MVFYLETRCARPETKLMITVVSPLFILISWDS